MSAVAETILRRRDMTSRGLNDNPRFCVRPIDSSVLRAFVSVSCHEAGIVAGERIGEWRNGRARKLVQVDRAASHREPMAAGLAGNSNAEKLR